MNMINSIGSLPRGASTSDAPGLTDEQEQQQQIAINAEIARLISAEAVITELAKGVERRVMAAINDLRAIEYCAGTSRLKNGLAEAIDMLQHFQAMTPDDYAVRLIDALNELPNVNLIAVEIEGEDQ